MPETIDERISRRNYLKYIGAAIAAAGIGYYLYTKNKKEGTSTLTKTETSSITETQAHTLSSLASYAKSKGLSNHVIESLENKLGDKLTDNNKALIDYLFNLSQSEVVSPEVLQFAPSGYRYSVVESLQVKTIDQVVEESKVPDQTVVGLNYLSNFPGYTQRWYIEQHGLDASAIDLLTRAKSLGNQDFAKYAVNSLVCIQDHNPLTTAEVAFLKNPGNKFREVRDSYLAEMESKGNPYDDFAKDWRKMLDRSGVRKEMESLDATEDWVYLVLNSDNPEVKEAEELKLKGGTPDSKDFRYTVPNYNTEQLVQYWLGKQNEFKGNDTLAQAIAMVNGLWVTMGDEQVRKAVYKDTNDLLNFFRETNEIQKARGYYCLEEYPLEAKVCLAWTGGDPNRGGHIHFVSSKGHQSSWPPLNIHSFVEFEWRPVTLADYEWNTTSIKMLRKARELIDVKGWVNKNVNHTVSNLENYFYFYPRQWEFTYPDDVIEVYGEKTLNRNMNNADFVFEYFLEHGKGIGVCGDETTFMEALCKSFGISTLRLTRTWDESNHEHIIYYEPVSKVWKAYPKQITIGEGTQNVYIFKPPIIFHNFFRYEMDNKKGGEGLRMLNLYHKMLEMSENQVIKMFATEGVQTSTIKTWIVER
jgi:hypothetical protein